MNAPVKDLIADRKLYIGSSDARDIIAGTYDKLFRLKTGRLEEVNLDDNFKVQLGKLTEPFHLDWTLRALNHEAGQAYTIIPEPEDGQHWCEYVPDGTFNSPVLGSHPDHIIRHDSGQQYAVEVKHTGRFRSADEAADFYMPQIQHHMLTWGASQLLFSVICGTEEPERIWVGASREWQSYYIERCDAFWGYLKSDVPPPPSPVSQTTAKVPAPIKATVPLNGFKKRDVTGNNEIMALLPEYITTKKAAKRHEEIKKDLKAHMADDENCLYAEGFKMERNAKGSILFKQVDEEKWGS